MIDINKGRYWDDGVKIVSGCTRCSDGCKNCWSLAMEYRFEGTHDKYGNIKALPTHKIEVYPDRLKRFSTKKSKVFAIWNDLFHIEVYPDRLKLFSTKKSKVFAIWNDLFHEEVSEVFQYATYRTMILNKQNTYLILTKRPAIMAKFFSPETCFTLPTFEGIWHGLTICNQQEADEKIPIFLQVPGKKFLSIEPMLGPIDFIHRGPGGIFYKPNIDAVILGGETGAGARPLHPDWVRSVRDQCQSAGVPFFFKQWGEWQPFEPMADQFPTCGDYLSDSKYKQYDWDDYRYSLKVGRNKAGRILDGRTHDELPWVKK